MALAVVYLTEFGVARPAHVRLLVAVVTDLPLFTRLANKINKIFKLTSFNKINTF